MTEQCIFSLGSPPRNSAMSLLVSALASSMVLPLSSSVKTELEAMAEAQPKVWKLASSMTPASLI